MTPIKNPFLLAFLVEVGNNKEVNSNSGIPKQSLN